VYVHSLTKERPLLHLPLVRHGHSIQPRCNALLIRDIPTGTISSTGFVVLVLREGADREIGDWGNKCAWKVLDTF
jgi:hypothetical protein